MQKIVTTQRSRATALCTLFLATGVASASVGGQLGKLLPKDGAALDTFGYAVAVSGTTAIVGAYNDDENGPFSGSANLFDTSTQQELAKLLPNDGAEMEQFGISVAISGTRAIVGAYLDDDNGPASGSAYLFDTTTGEQIAKLLPEDGEAGDCFGFSVSISGRTAIVGAFNDNDNGTESGSAYLFDVTTGSQIAKLLPKDGFALDNFGYSVAISGKTAIVGAIGDDDNGPRSGSAYLFDTRTGQQISKLVPMDGEDSGNFGFSVALNRRTAIIGAIGDNDYGFDSGAAYLFDVGTGLERAKLTPSDGGFLHRFGVSVGISGTTAVIGAFLDSTTIIQAGSAYLYDTTTGLLIEKLEAAAPDESDLFGQSVAISRSAVIVGAVGDDDNGPGAGAAYLFDS